MCCLVYCFVDLVLCGILWLVACRLFGVVRLWCVICICSLGFADSGGLCGFAVCLL